METDYIEIGPVPSDEKCQQVGSADYNPQAAREECKRFIRAIQKVCGNEPLGATLIVRSNPHDFGVYYEVAVKYEVGNSAALNYALKVESEAPTSWPEGV